MDYTMRGLTDTLLSWIAMAGVAASLIACLIALPTLPDRIPIHFNLAGEADRWGSKWVLLTLPALAIGMHLMFTGLMRLPRMFWNLPFASSEANAARQLAIAGRLVATLRAEVAWIFLLLVGEVIWVAHGGPGLGAMLLPLILSMVGVTVVLGIVACVRAR